VDSPTGSPQDGPPHHVADLVARAARRTPDAAAIVDVTSGTTLSWAQFDAAVSAEADRLREAGAGAGERVLVRLGNGAAFCVSVLGAVRAGAVSVPFGPVAVARELEIVLDDCRPAIVVAAEGDDAAHRCGPPRGAALLPPPDLHAAAAVDAVGGGEDIALLIYTSGTTGRPRGVQLSHRAVLANREQTAALRPAPVLPVDRILLSIPLFHVFGLGAGLLRSAGRVPRSCSPSASTRPTSPTCSCASA
jgi:long-chain acyl-CoA synthetase